jgi:glycosyltransferase involved in cell wall biosynthesis
VISVVIAVRDGMPWLDEQLRAVSEQQCRDEWEVLVADNGSTDSSPRVATSWAERFPEIRLVDASSRPGPAAARNIGAAFARGDLLAFCDADDVVHPGWLQAIGAALADSDVVAGALEHGSLNGAAETTPLPVATRQLGQIPAGLGANLGVRKSAFESVGGFDEELRVAEDIDLCWRLQFAGYKFATSIDAVVSKRERGTGPEIFRHGVAHGRSGPRLYRKHQASGIRRDFRGTAKSWVWLVAEIPWLYRRELRRRWLRAAGVRVGRLTGSFENRVFFP